MKVARDSWNIIEWIIRRYPQTKAEYQDYFEEIMSSSGSSDGQPTAHNNGSIVETKAIKLTNSVKMDRMRREIAAVEIAYNSLRQEEQEIIRIRYWTTKWRNVPFHKMPQVSYSDTQKRRIAKKMIVNVGRYLGEI